MMCILGRIWKWDLWVGMDKYYEHSITSFRKGEEIMNEVNILEKRRQLIRDMECDPWIKLSRAFLEMKKPDRKIDEDKNGIKGEGK